MLIENHRYPSIKELSDILEIDIQYLGELLNAKLGGWDSLYNNTTEDNNLMLIDIVEDEYDYVMKFIDDDFILELLNVLTDREKYIIYGRYIYELTQEEMNNFTRVARQLNSMGIPMAGLDVIDGRIIEVNVTSPCYFIKEINNLYGIHLEREICDFLLTGTLLSLKK